MAEAQRSDAGSAAVLDRFGGNVPVNDRKAALTALLASRARHAGDPRFEEGRARLFELALDHLAPPGDRLLAIAESIRAVQNLKRLQQDTTQRLQPAFTNVLPPLNLLSEAEDRLNVARACRRAAAPWLRDYINQAIADEEGGELARSELIYALLERSTTLSKAIGLLGQSFSILTPTTAKPVETIARRLTRTLAALREAIVRSPVEAGERIGDALLKLVSGAIRSQVIDDAKVTVTLADEVLLTAHDIVRTCFSVATEPDTLAVVAYLRRMLGGGSWPSELQPALRLLIADIREALLLLGRQRIADQAILDQLQVLTNFPERARSIAKELAAAHPELPENVRDWLEHGRVRQLREASPTAAETIARDADSHIGFALITARALAGSTLALEPSLISTVEVYEPNLKVAAQEHFKRVAVAIAEIEDAARKRRLDLVGSTGDEVEYAPKFFDFVGAIARQRGRVRQPAVVRLKPDGRPGDVVVKGLVE